MPAAASLIAAGLMLLPMVLVAQQGRGGGQAAPPTPQAAAPIDLTGYWMSTIVDEWRFRVSPQKGDILYLPLNSEARQVANGWDPAKDEADGKQCKAYGAVGVMQRPGRLHITWENPTTLKIETDAGTQTRLFHFGGKAPERAEPTWQGYSVANWEQPLRPPEASGLGVQRVGNNGRSLEVVTTQLRPGYLRKNGVPYSANAVVNEYYDRHKEPNGDEYFTVTTVVTDPEYLAVPFVTSSDFRREADGTKFSPTACSAR